MNMRLLVKASSLLYNHTDSPHPHCSRDQLGLVRDIAGNALLKNLESAFKASTLAQAPKEKLIGLFLVLFGAVIATTYTATVEEFREARRELLRILTHHLLFIGERVGLLDCNLTKQRLTEGYDVMWDKIGSFGWHYEYADSLNAACCSLDYYERFIPGNNDRGYNEVSSIEPPNSAVRKLDTGYSISHELPITNNDCCYQQARDSAYDCVRSPAVNHSSLPISVEMVTCSHCKRPFPSDEMCPACFNPPSLKPDYNCANRQGGFLLAEHPTESGVLPCVVTSTEADSFRSCTEVRQSEPSTSNTIHGSGSCSKSPWTRSSTYESQTSAKKDALPNINSDSDQSRVRFKDKAQKLWEKSNKLIQSKRFKRQEKRRESKSEKLSLPKASFKLADSKTQGGARQQLSYHKVEDSGCWAGCHHVKCSSCRYSSGGMDIWICCQCKIPQSAALSQSCGGVGRSDTELYPHSSHSQGGLV